MDGKTATLTKHFSIAPCDGPSVPCDQSQDRLFIFRLREQDDGRERSGRLARSSQPRRSGRALTEQAFSMTATPSARMDADGNIDRSGETSPGKFRITSQPFRAGQGARTIGSDQKAHQLYLPAAEFGPPPAAAPAGGRKKQAGRSRFPIVFEIIVSWGVRKRSSRAAGDRFLPLVVFLKPSLRRLLPERQNTRRRH